MSRFLLAFSFIAALTSGAAAQRFAQPPADAPVSSEVSITRLQAPNRAELRAKLAQHRKANLARFRAYQANGVFPSNTFTPGKLNVWIDGAGHLCAAATIINASGHAELVQQVGATNNFIRLADVTDGELMDWILTSGFTQSEIAAIQEPFIGVAPDDAGEPGRYVGVGPGRPMRVDPALRRTEDARLMATYKRVDAMLVKQQRRSLDAAVDRLMEHPTLAWSFLNS
ncbi:MAG TPA: hypothetical protein VM513_08380 [Kofleriaceae bacterium]|nr:hypothetical protein [Kofleriaceae bacterium]